MKIQFNVTTDYNETALLKRIDTKVSAAQMALDAQVLADSNFFCPLKTGTLQHSAIINTKIGQGEIKWRTPYARRLYYEYSKPIYAFNPNAQAKWFEAAKAEYKTKWIKVVNDRIKS